MYNQGNYPPPQNQGIPSQGQMQQMNPPQHPQGFFPPPPVSPSVQAPKKKGRKGKAIAAFLALAVIAVLAVVISGNVRAAREAEELRALQMEVTAVENVFLQNVYVDDIHLGGMTAEQGLNAVYQQQENRQNSWQLQLTYQGQVLGVLNYASLGITASRQEAYELVRNAFEVGKTGTLQERKLTMDNLKITPYKLYSSQTSLNEDMLAGILAHLKAQFTYEAADAHLSYFVASYDDPFIIQPEIYGSSLDTDVLKSQILAILSSGQSASLEIQPERIAPEITEADIRKKVTLLNKTITPISPESTYERTNNIRVAFEKMNGLVLTPGESFSFNSRVGARTLENGFKYAIEYVNGEEEMGIGGGVCQASTSIYLAALQSGLEITKRTPHSDPVSYTVFGQDATVFYSRDRKIDFAFRNNTDGDIYITAKVVEYKKGKYQCEVCIYGPTLGENVSYTLRTETVETILAPLTPIYRKDTNQAYVKYTDQEKLVRKARDGYITETYLQRWEGGTMVEETLVSRDTCEARAAIYYVGTQYR